MKLLLDQNLSPHLLEDLRDAYPGSSHVREFGMESAADAAIWEFAEREGFTVVSKDGDFRHMSFLNGAPPKVVWVRLGNCTTGQIRDRLRDGVERVAELEADGEAAFLTLE